MIGRILVIAQTVWLETLRRKDVYLLAVMALAALAVLMVLNVFGMRNLAGYIKETGLMLAWVFAWILAVAVGVRQLPGEELSGTVFSLLAKPVTRLELVAGKWLGTWSIVSAATASFYLVLAAVVLARGGSFGPATTAQALVLHVCFIGVVSSAAVLFSTRLHADAAATLTAALTLAAFLVIPQSAGYAGELGGFAGGLLLAFYFSLPHLELFDLRARVVHDWEALSTSVFCQIALYGLALMLLFTALAWLAYRGKRFSREDLW